MRKCISQIPDREPRIISQFSVNLFYDFVGLISVYVCAEIFNLDNSFENLDTRPTISNNFSN